jgi:nicotinate-nucleotide adenylyltransferase
MEFLRRAAGRPSKLGILPGAFHPPTCAHLALARAALAEVDEVLFVLPRAFPHKQYEAVGLAERTRLVAQATAGEPRFSVGISDGGLFIEIARECRDAYGPGTDLWFVCGRDAAERIVNWDYGRPGAIEEMLEEFGLLVADRDGRYDPPLHLAKRIRRLPLPGDYAEVSATEVRTRISTGRPWEHLVPESIVDLVRRLYRPA